MRSLLALFIDVVLVVAATAFAIELRLGIEGEVPTANRTLPYLGLTTVVSAIVLYCSGINRGVWRYSALEDYVRVSGAVTLTVAFVLFAQFGIDRLAGIARSMPVLQVVLATALLVGARVSARLWHHRRQKLKDVRPLQMPHPTKARTVLIVGLTDLTQMYVRLVEQQAPPTVRIAGILGRSKRHVGRLIGHVEVLGQPEHVQDIIRRLSTHGVFVDEVVVAAPLAELSAGARQQLDGVRANGVAVTALTDVLNTGTVAPRMAPVPPTGAPEAAVAVARLASDDKDARLAFDIPPATLRAIARRPYWPLKRVTDLILALALLVLLAPVIAFVALVVAIDAGTPIVFWQQRPGLSGRPFRVYKFRTMGAAHASNGRKLTDEQRLSPVGRFLRRTRLDELPQLVNIIMGEMSFVGPRPLLPVDQPAAYRARLMVRPGLTGWAQVVGGRTISANDKAALDVWYVLNASLRLDVSVAFRTIGVVLRGERVDDALIGKAWADLRQSQTYRDPHAPTYDTPPARSEPAAPMPARALA
jgi:lipopolysaccharide/colanic/teichoic acid biosynthesis glycosyltransferase